MNRIDIISPPDVLVFGTNIRHEDDLVIFRTLMNSDTRIHRWTVDLADCDKVLRIEAHDLSPQEIIDRVSRAGYTCREL